MAEAGQKLSKQNKDLFNVSYSLSSIYEFIANAYSNIEFQEFLESQPPIKNTYTAKGKNLWLQFVNAVRKALGFDPKQETALTQTLRASSAIEQSDMDLNTGLTTAFAKTAAGGGMDFNSEAQANTRIGAVFRKLNVGTKRFLNKNNVDIDPLPNDVATILNAADKQTPYKPSLSDYQSTIVFNTAASKNSAKEQFFGGYDKTIKTINENTPPSIDPIIDKVSEMPSWWRRIYYGLLSLGQLADTVRRFNPQLANQIERIERVSSMRMARVEEIRMRFKNDLIKIKELVNRANVDEETLKKFYILSHESTLADEDGKRFDLREVFLPPPNPNDSNYEDRMRVRNSELFKEFSQFPQELHLVYKMIVDTYEIVGDQYLKSIAGQLLPTAEYDTKKRNLNKKINDNRATEEEIAQAKEELKKLDAKILTDTQKLAKTLFGSRIMPFLPLVRRGDYWIKEKIEDPTFTAEKEIIKKLKEANAPQAEIDRAKEVLKQKQEAGKNAGRSWAFETEREAKRAKRELEKGGKDPVTKETVDPVVFENDYGDNGVFTRSGNPATFENAVLGESTKYREELRQLIAKLRKLGYTDAKDPTTGAYVDPRMAELLLDLQEKFLDTHSNESLVQQWRKRREIPGYQIDLVENFAHMGMKYANQIAMLETAPELTAATLAARETISAKPGSVERSVDETLKGRSGFLRDPTPSRWSALAAYGGYSWFILGNISSAVVNLTQLPLLGYGLMAGEFGYKKAGEALLSTMRMYAKGGRDDNTSLKIGNVSLADFTLFGGKNSTQKELDKYGLTVEEMQELRDLGLARGRVRRSSAQELQDVRRGSVKGFTGKLAVAELAGGWAFQNTERLNREVGLVMAYRLAKGKYKNATREQNMERALQIVEEMNGPAIAEVGPEFLQNNLGKAVGVFKKFAFAMVYIQWKLTRDAFFTLKKVERNPNLPADMPSVQELAKKQFFSTMIPAYLFAGMRGLPFVGAIALLYNLLADDDDPTWNEAVRASVGDLSFRGPMSHFLNLDFASRTGFYSMLYRDDPYRRAKVGDLAYTFESFLGPVYSASIGNIDRASRFLEEGRTFDAIQTTLPSFVRNGMKSYDLAMNGALNSKGYPLVDNVNEYNVAMQFFGFSPNDISRAYEKNEFLSRRQRAVYSERSRLLTQYYMAYQMQDTDELKEIRKKINEFNSKKLVQQMGRTITGDTISKSVRMRDKKAQEAINGLVLPLKERIAIERELGY